MLNFQIRGAGIEYYLSGIDEDNKKKILKDISNKKVSLAQIMINKNWRTKNSIYKSLELESISNSNRMFCGGKFKRLPQSIKFKVY